MGRTGATATGGIVLSAVGSCCWPVSDVVAAASDTRAAGAPAGLVCEAAVEVPDNDGRALLVGVVVVGVVGPGVVDDDVDVDVDAAGVPVGAELVAAGVDIDELAPAALGVDDTACGVECSCVVECSVAAGACVAVSECGAAGSCVLPDCLVSPECWPLSCGCCAVSVWV